MTETPKEPQVSIIIPVYNVEDYLPRCLNSILAQTLMDWECICVDDGSPDACGAILDEFAAKDNRFVAIHQQNGGTSAARNAGLNAARAEYIGFVDSDDWIESETYETALDAARRTDADIVQWGYTEKHGSNSAPSRELPEGFFRAELEHKYFCPSVCVKLFRSTFIFENGIRFQPGIRRGEDCNFSLVAYAHAKKCFCLSRSLYCYDKTRLSAITRNSLTAEALLDAAEARKKTCELVEERLRFNEDFSMPKKNRKISQFLFARKAESKSNFLFVLPEPDLQLFRSCFPELNRRTFGWFLKERTKKAFISLLAACHLDALVRAFFSRRKKLKATSACPQ